MVKSGLILGLVALIITALVTLILPICTPILAIIIGFFAGYLAGVFDKPINDGQSAKIGAIAGAISGVGAILGQIIGAAIKANVVGPEGVMEIMRQFDIPVSSDILNLYTPMVYGSAICIGLVNVLLMAGLGTLGGLLWHQISGKKSQPVV